MMRPIRFALVVTALAVSAMSSGYGQEREGSPPPCTFPAADHVTKPLVVGPEIITTRVEVSQSPDAPIRILRVDFTGATLTMGGSFRFTHNWSVEVVNVTDQTTTGIGPMVWVYSGNAK